MEIEQGKVEIDEIDLGFCLIYVLYMVLPCGYTDSIGAYKIERKRSGVNKMIILGLNLFHNVFPNLFSYYDKTW
jgi:hypothetical protein